MVEKLLNWSYNLQFLLIRPNLPFQVPIMACYSYKIKYFPFSKTLSLFYLLLMVTDFLAPNGSNIPKKEKKIKVFFCLLAPNKEFFGPLALSLLSILQLVSSHLER
jgi:hypothetical protein